MNSCFEWTVLNIQHHSNCKYFVKWHYIYIFHILLQQQLPLISGHDTTPGTLLSE